MAGVPTGMALLPSSDDGGGLSVGAKAGISVGATVAGLSLLTFIVWFIMARRRQRRRTSSPSPPPQQNLGPMAPASAVQSPSGPVISHLSPPTGHSSQDYFGPDATTGPFTGNGGEAHAAGIAANRTAVPVRPQVPGDITAPVEMGPSSVAHPPLPSRYPTGSHDGEPADHEDNPPGAHQKSTGGRFELL